MKIIAIRAILVGGELVAPGKTADVADNVATTLVALGRARLAPAKSAKRRTATAGPQETAEAPKGKRTK